MVLQLTMQLLEIFTFQVWCAAANSLQSCLTLCNPIDGSPPASPVPGVLQARTLEWVAISFSSAWKGKVKGKLLSRLRLFATPWTAAHHASPSMGFARQKDWIELPLPSPIKSRIYTIFWKASKIPFYFITLYLFEFIHIGIASRDDKFEEKSQSHQYQFLQSYNKDSFWIC